jgi:endonuclease YncB( thermonuclease family)
MKVLRLALAAALGVLLAASAATAQTRVLVRGTISKIDGKTVTVAAREGTTDTIRLADKWTVALVEPIAVSAIKPGSFVGIASLRNEALEVLVFPEAMRGAGEGHYPWDLKPQSMMTNATVATVAQASDGQTLKLDYKGGTQTIHVKPGTPVVTFAPGQQSDARPGAKVFIGAMKAADGTLTASRLNVGKDGMMPPM